MIVNDFGGKTVFGSFPGSDTATAGNARITNNAFGETEFNAFTRAGSADYHHEQFRHHQLLGTNTSADSANIITNAGGETDFNNNATAATGDHRH